MYCENRQSHRTKSWTFLEEWGNEYGKKKPTTIHKSKQTRNLHIWQVGGSGEKTPNQPNIDGVHVRNTYLKESHLGPQVIWRQLSCVYKL